MTETKPDPYTLNRKKKRRRIILTILLLVLVVLALSILKIVLIFTGESKITVDYVAQWERISKPSDYDPNQNAVFDYQKAVEHLVQAPNSFWYTPMMDWPGDMNDTTLGILRSWLKSNDKALLHLERGSRKRHCFMQNTYPDNSLVDYKSGLDAVRAWQLHYLAMWQAELNATDSLIDEAIEDLQMGFRLTAHLMMTKTSVERVIASNKRNDNVSIALQILNKTTPSSDQLKYFQEELERIFESDKIGLDFGFDRLATLDLIQRTYTDNGKGNGHLCLNAKDVMPMISAYYSGFITPGSPTKQKKTNVRERAFAYRLVATGPNRKQTTKMTHRVFDQIESLKNKTFWQLKNEHAGDIDFTKKMLRDYVVLFREFGHYQSLESYQKRQAELNALIATLGILRYKQDKGTLPEDLRQLVRAGYLKQLPMDPFSTWPLAYEPTGVDFILYSFGDDCDDDGGRHTPWSLSDTDSDHVFWPIEEWDSND